jgi:hypothetical protein
MANTDSNITEWISETRRKASVVVNTGGQADEITQLTVLLGGLLPQFDNIRLPLQRDTNMTFSNAIPILMDFAHSENLLTTTKTGSKRGTNAFVLDVKQTGTPGPAPCRRWKKGTCAYGDRCKFSHTGNGGLASAAESAAFFEEKRKLQDTSSSPKLNPRAPKNTPPVANVHMIHTDADFEDEEEVDYSRYSHVFGLDAPLSPPRSVSSLGPPAITQSELVFSTALPPTTAHLSLTNNSTPVTNTLYGGGAKADSLGLEGIATDNKTDSVVLGTQFWILLIAVPLVCVVFALDSGTTRRIVTSVAIGLLILALSLSFEIVYYLTNLRRLLCSICTGRTVAITALISLLAANFVGASESGDNVPGAFVSTVLFNGAGTGVLGDSVWCCDTGTNRFVTNDSSDFIPGSVVNEVTSVAVGGGATSSPQHGTVLLRSTVHKRIVCAKNVLFMPLCAKKLMPVSPFTMKGCSLTVTSTVALSDSHDRPLFTGFQQGGLFYFPCEVVKDSNCKSNDVFFGLPADPTKYSTSSADFPQRLLEAHFALGHLAFPKVRKFLGLKDGENPRCTTCAVALSRTAPLPKTTQRSTRINHRIHLDLGFTRGNSHSFQLAVDDFTRVSYLSVLDSKSDVLSSWTDLKTHLEKRHAPWAFAIVKTDSEPIYTTPAWADHCKAEGLEREFSSRYRHDGNGVVEAAIRNVGVPFRCAMIQGNAPDSDVPYVLNHSNLLRNNCPTKANNGWTPREKEAGMRLAVNPRLIQAPILCLCYAHIYAEEGRVKHAARGIACVYLGLDETSNSFRVKEWTTGKIYFTADIVFHPSTFPYVASPDRTFVETAPQITVQASPPIVLPRPSPLVVIPRIGGNKIRIRYPTQPMRETVAQGAQ